MDKEKAIERKIHRTEQQYQELLLKTQFLKQQKTIIKKDIEFYKSAITRLSFIYDIPAD